jgi:hypothetical protein
MVYLVRERFEAVVRPDSPSRAYITIMPGSTVTVLDKARKSDTVRIAYMDRIVTASLRDIHEKATLADGKTAG